MTFALYDSFRYIDEQESRHCGGGSTFSSVSADSNMCLSITEKGIKGERRGKEGCEERSKILCLCGDLSKSIKFYQFFYL